MMRVSEIKHDTNHNDNWFRKTLIVTVRKMETKQLIAQPLIILT